MDKRYRFRANTRVIHLLAGITFDAGSYGMQHLSTVEELEKFLGISLSAYYPKPAIDHQGIRVGHVGDNIAKAIKEGNSDAVRIACSILIGDPHLPFGKLIKSGISRALKKRFELLSPVERASLGKKTSQLLSLEFCPREVEDYCKLVKKFGPEASQTVADASLPLNAKSKFLKEYLKSPNYSSRFRPMLPEDLE